MEADDDKAWHQPPNSRTGENVDSAIPFDSCAAVKGVAIQSVTVALFLLLHHIMKIFVRRSALCGAACRCACSLAKTVRSGENTEQLI